MRDKPELMLIVVMSAFALTGVIGVTLHKAATPVVLIEPPIQVVQPVQNVADATSWFESIRQYCNPVEVETRMRWQPGPETVDGEMHKAACFALAGKIDRAREVIEALPEDRQYHAAGVVFNAGHPAADAGDEIAAGPLMELVVEYWPNHYMALYHAGAARFELGDHEVAKGYLERFLVEYSAEDGWRSSALSMLDAIEAQ